MWDELKEYKDQISSDEARAYADRYGLLIRAPRDNELFIDIDNGTQMDTFKSRFEMLQSWIEVLEKPEITPSKGGGDKRHIVVKLAHSVTTVERLFLQLFLGSDPIREKLSFFRYLNDDPYPTLFFERK